MSSPGFDTVLRVLSNPRRRLALRLATEYGETTTQELTTEVAARENEKSVSELADVEEKRVYVALYQTHLPKLEQAGMITYEGHHVEPAEWTRELWGPLQELEAVIDDTIDTRDSAVGIGIGGLRFEVSRVGGESP